MEFNPSKCKILCFTTKEIHQSGNTYFVEILEEVDSHPHLGVLLDNKMR